jgi:hypothetical protein
MDRNSPLPTSRIKAGTVIAQTRDREVAAVTLDSPALESLTDLTREGRHDQPVDDAAAGRADHDQPGRAHAVGRERHAGH